jgi:S-adenosylmethionine:tRNA ribosyltransferase-isomerase
LGELIKFDGKATGEVVGVGEAGRREIRFDTPLPFDEYLERYGHTPLPPYINRPDRPDDAEAYQTVYARALGAVAAPTAGLHFTVALLQKLAAAGVTRAELILHVGPGTFRPLLTETVQEHTLDPEWFRVPPGTLSQIEETRSAGGRVIAVGTTTVRVLETIATQGSPDDGIEGWADLLIAPPHRFRMVDAMITNFHLPRTSLLALVAARAGLELTLEAYRQAIEKRYRFYSYGDAMLIV